MRKTAVTIAYVLGAVYVLVGLVGFAITGFSDFAHTEGPTLLIFEINPLHNVVHLGVGFALIAAGASTAAGLRAIAMTIAVVYGLVGVVGFFIADTALNILALNLSDHILHIGSAAVLFYVAAQAGDARSPATA